MNDNEVENIEEDNISPGKTVIGSHNKLKTFRLSVPNLNIDLKQLKTNDKQNESKDDNSDIDNTEEEKPKEIEHIVRLRLFMDHWSVTTFYSIITLYALFAEDMKMIFTDIVILILKLLFYIKHNLLYL